MHFNKSVHWCDDRFLSAPFVRSNVQNLIFKLESKTIEIKRIQVVGEKNAFFDSELKIETFLQFYQILQTKNFNMRKPACCTRCILCRSKNAERARGSISPTFYEQLLRSQIPKALKRLSTQADFCAFGICGRKRCA